MSRFLVPPQFHPVLSRQRGPLFRRILGKGSWHTALPLLEEGMCLPSRTLKSILRPLRGSVSFFLETGKLGFMQVELKLLNNF